MNKVTVISILFLCWTQVVFAQYEQDSKKENNFHVYYTSIQKLPPIVKNTEDVRVLYRTDISAEKRDSLIKIGEMVLLATVSAKNCNYFQGIYRLKKYAKENGANIVYINAQDDYKDLAYLMYNFAATFYRLE